MQVAGHGCTAPAASHLHFGIKIRSLISVVIIVIVVIEDNGVGWGRRARGSFATGCPLAGGSRYDALREGVDLCA